MAILGCLDVPSAGHYRLDGQAVEQLNDDQLADCLLYTSDAADERSSVDLGGRRIIKKKNRKRVQEQRNIRQKNTAQNALKRD